MAELQNFILNVPAIPVSFTREIVNVLLENKNYWLRFAKLQQKLVKFSEAADLMKSQLEAMCDVIDPSIGKRKNACFDTK
mgnify:CR=1 FL=1